MTDVTSQQTGPAQDRSISDRVIEASIWIIFLAALWRDIVGNPTIIYIGNYNMTVSEPIFAAAATILVVRMRTEGLKITPLSILLITFSAILVANIFRGLAADPMAAIISLRSTGAFAIILLVTAVADPSDLISRRTLSVIDKVAIAFCVLVVLRLIFGPQLFNQVEGLSVRQINDGGRPLSAAGALIIAIAGAMRLSHLMRFRSGLLSWDSGKVALFVLALLFTGQGTATICGIVGLGIVWGYEAGALRSIRATIVLSLGLAVGILVVIAPEVFDPATWADLLPSPIAENVVRRQANLSTRELVWQGILAAYARAPLLNQILGWPSGTSPQVIVESRAWGSVVWEASAHSMYFGTLISHGIVGVVAFYIGLGLAGLIAMKRAIVGAIHERALSPAGSLALVAMLVLFSYSYNLGSEIGLVLAIAFIAIQGRTRGTPNEFDLRARYPDQIASARL